MTFVSRQRNGYSTQAEVRHRPPCDGGSTKSALRCQLSARPAGRLLTGKVRGERPLHRALVNPPRGVLQWVRGNTRVWLPRHPRHTQRIFWPTHALRTRMNTMIVAPGGAACHRPRRPRVKLAPAPRPPWPTLHVDLQALSGEKNISVVSIGFHSL